MVIDRYTAVDYPYTGTFYRIDIDRTLPLEEQEEQKQVVFETECDITESSHSWSRNFIWAKYAVYFPWDKELDEIQVQMGDIFEANVNGLVMNGKVVGVQTAHRVFKFEVALAEGQNILVAIAGSVTDSITLEKVDKEPAIYVLPEFNDRQEGVANWFKTMGSMDLEAPMEFPEGYYSIKDSIEEISRNDEAMAIVRKAVKLATNFDVAPGVGMWDMMKKMSPASMSGMIAGMPEGFIESLNAKLIKIKK